MNNLNRGVSRAERVSLRTAFQHEAHSFTTWLADNISALSESIGLDLTVTEREKPVGSFNVDLLCEDGQGNSVIIENQLEKSDHDHLGKVLTYMVNLGAKTAIWITPEARQEHQRVIDWLNETSGESASFYLIKVEAIRIADSPYAPLFTVLAQPDEQTREVGETKKEFAERHHKRFEFWTSLLKRSQGKTKLFSTISPGRNAWIATGSGKAGISFNYHIFQRGGGIELYIDYDKDTGQRNKAIFDALNREKEKIEQEFGESLEWQRLDDKRACRISLTFRDNGNLNEADKWPELQDMMIDAMIRFDKAFRGRLANIHV